MSLYGYDTGGAGGERSRSTGRIIAIAVAVVALLAVGFVVLQMRGGDDGGDAVAGGDAGTTTPSADDGAVAPATASSAVTPTSAAPATTESAPASTAARAATTTTLAPTTTKPAPTTTRAPRPTTTTAPPAADQPSYPTLADGSPVPVLAIFDVDTITLSGTVPSQKAAERLESLAIANSKTKASIINFLAINPDVPLNVGVRVLELTSARFPDGSAEVLPAHGVELDRVVTIMNALPNVSVLVVGHSDQRGDPASNFALSEDRARAVVTYLVGKGIDGSRLSSRAVGEADLISVADDETSLALNRRTEFIFYGLLLE